MEELQLGNVVRTATFFPVPVRSPAHSAVQLNSNPGPSNRSALVHRESKRRKRTFDGRMRVRTGAIRLVTVGWSRDPPHDLHVLPPVGPTDHVAAGPSAVPGGPGRVCAPMVSSSTRQPDASDAFGALRFASDGPDAPERSEPYPSRVGERTCFLSAEYTFRNCGGEIMDRAKVALRNCKISKEITEPMTVYVWDMDETLILLKSLLDGAYAGGFNGLKDRKKGIEIGKQWENLILKVCDECFFYEEIEDYNEPFLDALSEYDDGRDLSKYNFDNDGFGFPYDDWNKRKLAYRHRSISEKYSQGLQKILDQQTIKLWNDLYNLTDSYADGWLSSAHFLLEQTFGKACLSDNYLHPSDNAPESIDRKNQSINVLVTSGSLVPSLAKCLLYRLDDVILADNVYSSWEVGKLRCFSWVKERFGGENVKFCVIGDGREECEAAEAMGWPFIKMDLHPTSPRRFPGLSMKVVQSYIDVAYGSSEAEVEEIKETFSVEANSWETGFLGSSLIA